MSNLKNLFLSLIIIGCYKTTYAVNLEFKNNLGSTVVRQLADTSFDNTSYISAELLEYLFRNRGTPVLERQKYIIKDHKGISWYLTVDNPYILIGNEVYNLTFPVRRGISHYYLPLKQTLKILEQKYSCPLTFDSLKHSLICEKSDENRLCYKKSESNIIQITKSDLTNGSMVEVKLTESLPYHTLWLPPHFILNITRGILSPELLKKREWKGMVSAISTVQEDSVAQITVYLPKPIDTVEINYTETDKKISLLIRKPLKKEDKVEIQTPKKIKSTKKTIILDPGHGGRDPGASYKGIREKNIVLELARHLKSILKKKGFKVLLTREKDIYVPLRDRPKFASNHGGDLFLSLHCNAIEGTPKRKKTVEGFAAYILRAGESKEDNALARREKQVLMETKHKKSKAEITPVEWILLEHELNLYSHQSEKFAEKIVKNFESGKIKKHSTGARQAGFFVLVGTFMPAVLFEIGFMTNERDRRYMTSHRGQKDIANRLSNAITDFF